MVTGVPVRATTHLFLLNLVEKSLPVPSVSGQQHVLLQKVLSIYGATTELRNIADKLITFSLEDQTRGKSTA